MACPDDNLYGRLLEGRLSEAQRAPLERHVDECRACTELLAELGKVYAHKVGGEARRTPVAPAPRAPKAVPERALFGIELVQAAVQLTVAAKLGALLFGGSAAGPRWAIAAALLWGTAGGVLAACCAWGLLRRRAWAVRLARAHAWISLPSVIGTPLAWYVLSERGWDRVPARRSRHPGDSGHSLSRSR